MSLLFGLIFTSQAILFVHYYKNLFFYVFFVVMLLLFVNTYDVLDRNQGYAQEKLSESSYPFYILWYYADKKISTFTVLIKETKTNEFRLVRFEVSIEKFDRLEQDIRGRLQSANKKGNLLMARSHTGDNDDGGMNLEEIDVASLMPKK